MSWFTSWGKAVNMSKMEVYAALSMHAHIIMNEPDWLTEKDQVDGVVKVSFDIAEAMVAESERRKA